MLVRHNPISLLILYYQLDRNKICQDLNVTMEDLYFFESDGIDLPDYIITYFFEITNEHKNIFKF